MVRLVGNNGSLMDFKVNVNQENMKRSTISILLILERAEIIWEAFGALLLSQNAMDSQSKPRAIILAQILNDSALRRGKPARYKVFMRG
jgi:hypothetical protein